MTGSLVLYLNLGSGLNRRAAGQNGHLAGLQGGEGSGWDGAATPTLCAGVQGGSCCLMQLLRTAATMLSSVISTGGRS